MKFIINFILLAGLFLSAKAFPSSYSVRMEGKVTDSINGCPLTGVYVYFPELKKGGITDSSGIYQVPDLPAVETTVTVSYVGHQTIIRDIDLKVIHHLDFTLKESNAMLGEVIVKGLSGNSMLKTIPSPVSYISHRDLQEHSSTNIIDAISHEPGLAQIATGGGISKPVIRGLGYNRIVVVKDGVRQEGQQWGDEHGIEIDAQSVYAARILKGPASLIYGSDAMAGVIIFEDEPILPDGKIKAEASTEYQTNNGLFAYSLHAAGNKDKKVWSFRYSDKKAHAYKNSRDGYVFNSGFRERAFSGMFGFNGSWGYSHLTVSHYHLTPGIVEGERDSTTGEFLKPVAIDGSETEVPATHHDFKTYSKGVPYQQVYHLKAVSDNSFIIGDGTLKFLLSYQQNRRKEYEDVLNPNAYGLYFLLHTVNYDLHYLSPEYRGWHFSAGANGMFQQSLNKGHEYLTPAYRLFDFGMFLCGNRSMGNITFSGGIRFDNRSLNSHRLIEDEGERFAAFTRHFNDFTGSLGIIWQLSPQSNFRFNLSRGFRAPNISELASNGLHEGTVRYEIGNKNLKPESNWQTDLGFDFSSDIISAQLSLFANRIDNYIFACRQTDKDGQPILCEGLPTYQFTAGDAVLLGGELYADYHPVEKVHWENTLSYVNSVQLHQSAESKYLPFSPAPRWTTTVKYNIIRDGQTLNNTFVALNFEYHFRQDHFYAAGGTETATPDYGLMGMSLGTDIMYHRKRYASFFIEATNLANKAYQSHLSRLKSTDVNPITGRQGVYDMGRNITFKLIIPLIF